MSEDLLQYDRLVENALKGVVKAALRIVEQNGLPGAHHFYITFQTDHPGVEIPTYLREKYVDEMTIVLQYQFYNLRVEEEYFEVSLSFNNVQEDLHIPFAAITGFADPLVKFGLQFNIDEGFEQERNQTIALDFDEREADDDEPEQEPLPVTDEKGNVVQLDIFRKKK